VFRLVVTGGSLTRRPKGHFAVSWSRYSTSTPTKLQWR